MSRRWPIPVLVGLLVVLGGLGQAVTLYTDWLWFHEVQYSQIFLSVLLTRAGLVGVTALVFFATLYANARIAASRAAPDVFWELENTLRLPGYEVFALALGRALPVILAVVALFAGVAAAGHWQTVIGWWYQVPFGVRDPLFDRDVAFFVFTLPAWRLLLRWATVLVVGSLIVAALMHLTRGGVGLTERGLRVSRGARSHVLLLGAIWLLVKAIDFWLDRFDLVHSSRGIVFGATYTDVHASLPALSTLAVLAVGAGVAFAAQIRRPGFRLVLLALGSLALLWVAGLGFYPAGPSHPG